jgi:hypothetical protein
VKIEFWADGMLHDIRNRFVGICRHGGR